jgi:hypothetical protein
MGTWALGTSVPDEFGTSFSPSKGKIPALAFVLALITGLPLGGYVISCAASHLSTYPLLFASGTNTNALNNFTCHCEPEESGILILD